MRLAPAITGAEPKQMSPPMQPLHLHSLMRARGVRWARPASPPGCTNAVHVLRPDM